MCSGGLFFLKLCLLLQLKMPHIRKTELWLLLLICFFSLFCLFTNMKHPQ